MCCIMQLVVMILCPVHSVPYDFRAATDGHGQLHITCKGMLHCSLVVFLPWYYCNFAFQGDIVRKLKEDKVPESDLCRALADLKIAKKALEDKVRLHLLVLILLVVEILIFLQLHL